MFKGDNDNFLDPTPPGRSELVGKLWVHRPHGGAALAGFRRPLVGVAVVGGVAAVLLLGAEAKRWRRARLAPFAPFTAAPTASLPASATVAAPPASKPASPSPERPPSPAEAPIAAERAPSPAEALIAAAPAPASAAAHTRRAALPQPTWLTPRARPIPPTGCGLPVVLPQPRPFTPRTISAPVAPPLPALPAPVEEPVVEAPAPIPSARILARQRILIGAAVAAALFALLALVAFARPTTTSIAVETPYREAVTFRYHAALTPKARPVYPGGSISTGDPVLLRLTNRVQVTMGYRRTADAPHRLAGATDVVLRLISPSGWRRELPLAPEMPFEGDRANRVVTLDLDRIRTLTRRIERLTDAPAGSYSIAVVPRVHAAGTVAGQPLRTDYSPQATFELDAHRLRPTKGGEQTRQSVVTTVRGAQNTVGLRGHSLPVATVRRIALAGLALATLAALVALLPRFRRPADPKGRAHGRDGHLIVPITGIAVKPAQSAVDVATMDALVALAERGERLILHQRSDEADTFLVDDGATLFRHQIRHVAAAR